MYSHVDCWRVGWVYPILQKPSKLNPQPFNWVNYDQICPVIFLPHNSSCGYGSNVFKMDGW